METIAVYWESRIKTYGFQVTADVRLLEIDLPSSRTADLGQALVDFSEGGKKFLLVLAGPANGGELKINIALRPEDEGRFRETVSSRFQSEAEEFPTSGRPVEILQFQGPHFGDRYGIADSAFRALEKGGISPLALTCAGSSIHVVLSPGQAESALALLTEPFEVPKSSLVVERKK
ncbi:MAG: hypothetical protein V1816_02235 [Pseudomonadota bacterium]